MKSSGILQLFWAISVAFTFEANTNWENSRIKRAAKVSNEILHMMDKTLVAVRAEMKATGLDFFAVPDISFQLDDRSLTAYDGKVVGLEEFTSKTAVSLKGSVTTYNSTLSWSSLLVDFQAKLDIMAVRNKTGKIQADISDVVLKTVVRLDSQKQTITLDQFHPNVSGVRITNTGLGPVELKKGNDLAKETGKRAKEPILYVFNTAVKRVIITCLNKTQAIMFKSKKAG